MIELQNSKISKPTIRKREEFYGERMLWIINGIHFKNHFHECYSYNGFKYNYDEIAQEYYGSKSEYKGIKSEGRIMLFNWDYARRSWIDVQRDVFIDFGGYYLFWVTEGMGTKSGEGKYVGIRRIMEKYGGDYEYYLEHKSEMYSIREAL